MRFGVELHVLDAGQLAQREPVGRRPVAGIAEGDQLWPSAIARFSASAAGRGGVDDRRAGAEPVGMREVLGDCGSVPGGRRRDAPSRRPRMPRAGRRSAVASSSPSTTALTSAVGREPVVAEADLDRRWARASRHRPTAAGRPPSRRSTPPFRIASVADAARLQRPVDPRGGAEIGVVGALVDDHRGAIELDAEAAQDLRSARASVGSLPGLSSGPRNRP